MSGKCLLGLSDLVFAELRSEFVSFVSGYLALLCNDFGLVTLDKLAPRLGRELVQQVAVPLLREIDVTPDATKVTWKRSTVYDLPLFRVLLGC